jgi:hypothetical protein
VTDYAEFDLKPLSLNFSLASSSGVVSIVDHLSSHAGMPIIDHYRKSGRQREARPD